MKVNYIRIEEVTYGEPIEQRILDELLDLELVDARRESNRHVVIAETDCEDLRAMLRLATVLDINPAGIETIMHMRRRMATLQAELRRLKALERAYLSMRPPDTVQ